MNYLAHYVAAQRRSTYPDFLLGSVVPDIVGAWNRQYKFFRKAVAEHLERPDDALWRGIDHHLRSDAIFHRMSFFKEANDRLFQSFLEHLRPYTDARIFFLSHVSVEFLLDHMILETRPGLAEIFYADLSRSDLARIARVLAGHFDTDPRPLMSHFQHFLRLRFVDAYRSLDGLLNGLNGMLRRAGQPTLDDSAAGIWQSLIQNEKRTLQAFLPAWEKVFLSGESFD